MIFPKWMSENLGWDLIIILLCAREERERGGLESLGLPEEQMVTNREEDRQKRRKGRKGRRKQLHTFLPPNPVS